MSRSFRYPARALRAAYALGASGFAASAGALWLVRPASAPAWVLGTAAALFLVYFARTVCRQLTRVELDEAGIRARGPLGAAIRWENLRSMGLRYYSTRRDREEGWMQLKLRDDRRAIRVDSDLEDFVELVRAVATQARRRGAAVDAGSCANLRALGVAGW